MEGAPPDPLYKPRRGVQLSTNSKSGVLSVSYYVSVSAVFAAAYALGVVFLGPISYQLVQLRLADCLLPLTMVFGWPAVVGLTVGCLVANAFSGLGVVDLVGGSAANFLAGFLAWRIGLKGYRGAWLTGVLVEIVVIAVVVGGYLSVLFGVPATVGVLSLLASNEVTIGVIGYPLLRAVSKTSLTRVQASN